MSTIRLALLRGVCQMPAYAAQDRGFFRDEGIDTVLSIEPTAWTVPDRLERGETHFAVIPWTRVAAGVARNAPFVLICGSGIEEAALVIRKGMKPDQVRRVAVPQRGGMKDLTAQGLLANLGWEDKEQIRLPSGDGAILSFVGGGADAASMVEPYATMLVQLGMGTVIRRTGDIWPKAPGCSLTTTTTLAAKQPELVEAVVRAFVRGHQFVREAPDESAAIAARYIGVDQQVIRAALRSNSPDPDALRNHQAMEQVLTLMIDMGYLDHMPSGYADLRFLDRVQSCCPAHARHAA